VGNVQLRADKRPRPLVLRVNVGLGDTTGRRWQFPGFTGTELRWHQGDGGAAAQVLFRVEFSARIGAPPGT
jgi:hypothetical protein